MIGDFRFVVQHPTYSYPGRNIRINQLPQGNLLLETCETPINYSYPGRNIRINQLPQGNLFAGNFNQPRDAGWPI